MNERERARDGLERGVHRGVGSARGLELCERTAQMVQRDVRVRGDLVRALELMERAHGLGYRRREVYEVARNGRVRLKSIEPARERLACRA
jgi:hypothetical protein